MAVKPNKTKPAPITEAAIHELCEKGNQHNTERKPGLPGSPQPGAPKSHSVSHTGNRAHRIGAIQKLAMAMPCSEWKGEPE